MRLNSIFCHVMLALGLLLTLPTAAFKAGGGGSEQFPPATATAGTPITVGFIVNVWGDEGPIQGRFTDMVLHYKLAGETAYQTVAPVAAALPEKYRQATTKHNQWQAYEFVIPPYPAGTHGAITYYITLKLDGHASQQAGLKTIKLVPASEP